MAQNDSTSFTSHAVAGDHVISNTRLSTVTVYVCFGLTVRDWDIPSKDGKTVTRYKDRESLSLLPLHCDVVSKVFDLLKAGKVDEAASFLIDRDADGKLVTDANRNDANYRQGVVCNPDKFFKGQDGHTNKDNKRNQTLRTMVSGARFGLTQLAWVRTWLKKYGLYQITVSVEYFQPTAGQEHGTQLYIVDSLEPLTERPLTTDELPTFELPADKPATRSKKG